MCILSFIDTKMLQRMNSTLYRETEQHCQKQVFGCFSNYYVPKRHNAWKNPPYEKENNVSFECF